VPYINPFQHHRWIIFIEYSRKRPLVIVILTVEPPMIMKLIMTKKSFVLLRAMWLKRLVFFVFQEYIREAASQPLSLSEAETWNKVMQTQTYWSKICFQTYFPTFQWCFRIFFFFTFIIRHKSLQKKLRVNYDYNIYRLLVKIYYLQLPILNIMLVWLKRHRCDSSFKSTQHFRHSIISIMTRFGQLVNRTHFQYTHEKKKLNIV